MIGPKLGYVHFSKRETKVTQLIIGQYRSPAYFARLWSISSRPTLPGTSTIIKFCMSCSMVSVKNAHAKHSSYSLLRNCPDNVFKVSRLTLSYWTLAKLLTRSTYLKLLFKLSQHGIRGNTLTWIKSFLVGRTQAVVLEGESSEEVPVNSGVPRGSVLGPLLFLLYKKDQPHDIQSQVRLFAGDTVVCLTVRNNSYSEILQADLERLEIWERT